MSPPSKNDVKSSYDQLGGELYNLRYEDEQNQKYDVALRLTQPVGKDLFLDNGCGTGMFLKRLSSPGVGLDLTPSLLAEAKRKLRSIHHLIQGDSENLPFRGGVFHKVYAITLIQNTPDKETALLEMRRVTRTNGNIIVTALKTVFSIVSFRELLDKTGLIKGEIVMDSDTNDWIVCIEV
jgi:ubiquinone/menaquinone biosynthesis C-methylase UbiE